MKKTYKLVDEKRNIERIIEAIKYDVRKYIKREKNKKNTSDEFVWKFNCKSAVTEENAEIISFLDITKTIEAVATSEAETFYIEIVAYEEQRPAKVEKVILEKIEEKEETEEIEETEDKKEEL